MPTREMRWEMGASYWWYGYTMDTGHRRWQSTTGRYNSAPVEIGTSNGLDPRPKSLRARPTAATGAPGCMRCDVPTAPARAPGIKGLLLQRPAGFWSLPCAASPSRARRPLSVHNALTLPRDPGHPLARAQSGPAGGAANCAHLHRPGHRLYPLLESGIKKSLILS
jgi:hypothetical protein